MRCPKCHYLSFEPEPRCRNCGYDLSLGPGDLIFKTVDPPASDPLADFALDLREDLADVSRSMPDIADFGLAPALAESPLIEHAAAVVVLDPEPVLSVPTPAPSSTPVPVPLVVSVPAPAPERIAPPVRTMPIVPSSPTPALTGELPLFVQGLPAGESDLLESDEPLVKLPRAPRPPLAVRRPTPAPGRVREKYQQVAAPAARQVGLLERDLLEGSEAAAEMTPIVTPEAPPPMPAADAEAADLPATWRQPVGAVRRIEAAIVDVLFIGAINIAVVWLTLQRLDLSVGQAGLLPIVPFLAFFFLVDAGYLLMFTATNGQTIGKMLCGIRVVGTSPEAVINDQVTLGQAALRALLTFPSALAFGAGFLPALFGRGLAFHDRVAHTRVVRV